MAEIYQIRQIVATGKWQNTVTSDESNNGIIGIGPEFDTPAAAQEWFYINGPAELRRIRITINGNPQWISVFEVNMTYRQLVELSGFAGHPTMTYHARIGGDTIRQGTLIAGELLELVHGMRISVAHTDNA